MSECKNPMGSLWRQYPECFFADGPLIRVECEAIHHCCRFHERVHSKQHEAAFYSMLERIPNGCSIGKVSGKVIVKSKTSNWPYSAHELSTGTFWQLMTTDVYWVFGYRHARRSLLEETSEGAKYAYVHIMELLRIDLENTGGLEEVIVAIMLRLGRDQECYGFVKWWTERSEYGANRSEDAEQVALQCGELPDFELECADATEAVDFSPALVSSYFYLAVALVQLRLLVDIRNLKVARMLLFSKGLPYDIWARIGHFMVSSSASDRLIAASTKRLVEIEERLIEQVCKLMTEVALQDNYYICKRIRSPAEESHEDASRNVRDEFIHGLCEKPITLPYRATMNGRNSGDYEKLSCWSMTMAWLESKDVMSLLSKMQVLAAEKHGHPDHIAQLVKTGQFTLRNGDVSTREQKLRDVSVHYMWESLRLALADAAFLGPSHASPSGVESRN